MDEQKRKIDQVKQELDKLREIIRNPQDSDEFSWGVTRFKCRRRYLQHLQFQDVQQQEDN